MNAKEYAQYKRDKQISREIEHNKALSKQIHKTTKKFTSE